MLVLQAFIFRDGAFLGTEMCTGERIEIGRDPACDLVLDDDNVSRRHAMLFEHQGRVAIQDSGSAVGTTVSGQSAATPRIVGPRDDVVIGRFTIKFKQQPAQTAAPVGPSFDSLPPTMHAGGLSEPTLADARFPVGTPSLPMDASDEDRTIVDPRATSSPSQPSHPSDPSIPLSPAGFAGAMDPRMTDVMARGAGGRTIEDPFISSSGPSEPSGPLPVSFGSSAANAPRRGEAPFTPVGGAPLAMPWESGAVPVSPAPVPGVSNAGPSASSLVSPDAATHVRHSAIPSTSPPVPMATASSGAFSIDDDDADGGPTLDASPRVDASAPMMPGVEFVSNGTYFDDDEEEEPLPPWSLVHALVRANDPAEEKSKQVVVEVIHYRNETVLDHAEVNEGGGYSFGRAFSSEWRRDHGVPRGIKLVVHKRKNVAELLVNEHVQGKLLREGQQVDLRSLPEAQGKSGKVRLTEGDYASLEVMGDKVFVRFARVPPVRPTAEQLATAKQERKIFLSSSGTAVGAWLFLGLLAWVAQYRGLQERVIQLEDEGFAEVIEELPEVEIPEPEEPEEPELPEEPTPQEPPKVNEKPTPQPTPPTPDAPKKPGVLDALKNLPQPKAAGNQSLTSALSNIKGVDVPGASSYKVSSMVGKFQGGVQIGGASGGVDTNSLNSVLRKGGGTGKLAAGDQRAVKGQVKTLKRQSQVKGQGILTKEEIQKVINSHIGEIQYCYEKQLRTTPGLSGKVSLEWTIGTDGRVKLVKSANSTLKSADAMNCMMQKVKLWKFPEPRGSGSVIVTYPFIFNTI